MNTELYSITAKLYLIDGSSIDISSSIRELKITQSITSKLITYDLLLSNQVIKRINSELDYINFDIRFKQYDRFDKQMYSFDAVPISTTVPLFFSDYKQQEPYKDYTWIKLIDSKAFKIASKVIKSKIYTNISIAELVKQYYSNISFDNDINSNVYDQILIPTMTFDNLLEFIDYWYGFYEGSSCIVYHYDSDTADTNIKVVNISSKVKSSNYDFTLYKIEKDNLKQSLRMEEEDDKLFVITSPVVFTNKLAEAIKFRNITLIEKPDSKFINIEKYDIKEFIDNFCAVDSSIDFDEDNVKLLTDDNLSVRNHVYNRPVTSKLSRDFSQVTTTVTFENKRLFSIWPGHIIHLKFSNPDQIQFQGNYFCDVVRYHFKYDSGTWRELTTVILTRSNYLTR